MEIYKAGGLPLGTDVISCALGILIERYKCDDDTARSRLISLALGADVTPYDAAAWLIKDAHEAVPVDVGRWEAPLPAASALDRPRDEQR